MFGNAARTNGGNQPSPVGGMQLAISSGGSGPPALLVHGIGSSKTTWRALCAGLADSFTYYAIDLPGAGESPAPPEFDYSLENLAIVVKDFIVSKDLQHLTLIAHSFGAGVALLSLIGADDRFLKRIKCVCVLDGICYPQTMPSFVRALRSPVFGALLTELVPSNFQTRTVLESCYYDKSRITAEQVRRYGRMLSRPDVRHALRKTARQIDPNQLAKYVPLLSSINLPCLLIWGREDRIVPIQNGLRLQRDLPIAEIKIINNCGHMPHEECSRETVEALKAFLTKLTSRA